MAQLILPPDYDPKRDPRLEALQEAERQMTADAYQIEAHWRQRRSWRVRLRRRLIWWSVLLGHRPLVYDTSQFWALTPDLDPRAILKRPPGEAVAIALMIPELVIREELIMWLVRKKKISIDLRLGW